MNNKLRTFFAFSTIGLSTVCAATLEPIRVSVPFAFTAGKTNLPAGQYTVVEQDSKVIVIRGTKGSAMVLEQSSADDQHEKSGLSFRHTEKGYFLQQVHAAGRPASIVPVSETAEK